MTYSDGHPLIRRLRPWNPRKVATATTRADPFCTYNGDQMVTYDPAKRRLNVRKHGLDFEGCAALFDGFVYLWEDTREHYGETRSNAIGLLNGAVFVLTFVDEGESFRAISLRHATRSEIRRYAEAHP